MRTSELPLTEHHRAMLGMTMPQALERAAQTWGSRLAYVHIEDGEQLTWAELHERVQCARTGMRRAGVAKGDKVAVLLRNQAEFLITWLALAAQGAVIVPLNPKYTTREVEFVASDSDATWAVVADDLLELHVTDGRLCGLPEDRVFAVGDVTMFGRPYRDLFAYEPDDHPSPALPESLVNIQFTSGTTGLPKGCMLTHRYWIELGVYAAALFEDPQRLLADHPFYYMQNQAYFAIALAGGGTLYVTHGLSRRKFLGWLVDHRIDFAWIDEGMLDLPRSDLDRRLSLKRAPVDALPRGLHATLEERFGLQAREWYASTEIGAGTYVPFDRTDLVGSGTMGVCFPNRESKVVDTDLREVEPGRPGELCVRGSGMMLGYHNRPDVNAELFLPGGWFRTGDIVRKTDDGLHYYEGRMRDVIRRSGESIAAAEVELQIGTMPAVLEVGVVPVPDPHRGEEVKAIVVLQPGATATAGEIVEWAARGLAPFKVPRYVEFRDELPHTASGKVGKSVLRAEEPFSDAVVDTRPRIEALS